MHILSIFIICVFVIDVGGYLNKKDEFGLNSRRLKRGSGCADKTLCLSKWGYCGNSSAYCGAGCQSGPCTKIPTILNQTNFQCAFNNLNSATSAQQLNLLLQSGYKPFNADEVAVFLAHVYFESNGLRTLVEYCAPSCGPNYVQSWCGIKAVPGKSYYGRGWFQLSFPCNYYAAGKSLGLDLLNNPDLVSQRLDLAVKTAVWFFQANNMVDPAQRGDFAATTRIINGAQECKGGSGAADQQKRVAIYKRIRLCFGLGQPIINPTC